MNDQKHRVTEPDKELEKYPEDEINEAKKVLDDYNVSISGDININSNSDLNGAIEEGDMENYYGTLDETLSAHAENDGWEEGYDY